MLVQQCAWAAGFYDGEGHTGLSRSNKQSPALLLTVTQTHKEPLLRMQALFGGSIVGPYERKNPKWAPIYRWQLSRYEPIKTALSWMWPYLGSVKRAQAELALAKVKRSKEALAIRGPRCGHSYDRRLGKDRRCWQCTQKSNKRNYQKNKRHRIAQARVWALAHPEQRKAINDKANAKRKAIRLKLA